MKQKLIVSVVQMRVLSAKNNLPRILNYIERASKMNSEIICFPETVFNPNIREPSQEKDLIPIQKKCKSKNIFAIINGYFKTKNNSIYNRTYLIDNKGEILDSYDKIYLWINEMNKIKRGKKVKVINTPLGKIGLSVCWDIFFPKIFEKLRKNGAEIIFCPSYWFDSLKKEEKFIEYMPTVIAYQYMTFFIYCNAFLKGRIKGRTSISEIASPWGEIAKIKHKEGIITATLYSQRLKRFKNHFQSAFFERGFYLN